MQSAAFIPAHEPTRVAEPAQDALVRKPAPIIRLQQSGIGSRQRPHLWVLQTPIIEPHALARQFAPAMLGGIRRLVQETAQVDDRQLPCAQQAFKDVNPFVDVLGHQRSRQGRGLVQAAGKAKGVAAVGLPQTVPGMRRHALLQ